MSVEVPQNNKELYGNGCSIARNSFVVDIHCADRKRSKFWICPQWEDVILFVLLLKDLHHQRLGKEWNIWRILQGFLNSYFWMGGGVYIYCKGVNSLNVGVKPRASTLTIIRSANWSNEEMYCWHTGTSDSVCGMFRIYKSVEDR